MTQKIVKMSLFVRVLTHMSQMIHLGFSMGFFERSEHLNNFRLK